MLIDSRTFSATVKNGAISIRPEMCPKAHALSTRCLHGFADGVCSTASCSAPWGNQLTELSLPQGGGSQTCLHIRITQEALKSDRCPCPHPEMIPLVWAHGLGFGTVTRTPRSPNVHIWGLGTEGETAFLSQEAEKEKPLPG